MLHACVGDIVILDVRKNHKCMMGTGCLAPGSALTRPTFLFLRAYISCSNSSFLSWICTNSACHLVFINGNTVSFCYTIIHCTPLYTIHHYTLHTSIHCIASYITHHYTLHSTIHCKPLYNTHHIPLYTTIHKYHCTALYTVYHSTQHTTIHYTLCAIIQCISLDTVYHYTALDITTILQYTLYTIIHYTPLYTT